MFKVLIVDDSAVICAMLRRVMENDGRFEVIGMAHDGQAAVTKNSLLKPDLITMDINMPVMNGIEATREILKTSNPAVVAFTTEDKAEIGFKCMEAGALEIVKKPSMAEMTPKYLQDFCDRLALITNTHRLMSLTKGSVEKKETVRLTKPSGNYKMLLIGASTGGPTAIQTVMKGLSTDFKLPIIITQHIEDGFDDQFTKWLTDTTGIKVEMAASGVVAQKGHAYLAPAGRHLLIKKDADGNCVLELNMDPPVHFLRPAVDKTFESAADVLKSKVLAVLLTGMGKDGAEGCAAILRGGGFTIVEDESTCVVFGMPKAAIDKGAASVVLPVNKIAGYIKENVKVD